MTTETEQQQEAERKILKPWTTFYTPFGMGGELYRPTGFEIDVTDMEELDLGKGFKGYQLQSPGGKTVIVESESGGIVGNDLEKVKKDIEGAEVGFMKKQIQNARLQALGMRVLPAEDFWRTYDR